MARITTINDFVRKNKIQFFFENILKNFYTVSVSTIKNVPNRFKNRKGNFQKYRGNKEDKQEQQQVTTDESNEHIGSDQAE